MSDVSDWFTSLPIFTRYWLLFTAVLTLLGRFEFLSPHSLILWPDRFLNNFEIWRAVTSVFYYPTGFHFLINCYFLYNYSLRLERGEYDGKPADYCFLLLFNWICCVIIGLIGDFSLLMDPMVLSVLYVWCQLNKDAIVNFWFGMSRFSLSSILTSYFIVTLLYMLVYVKQSVGRHAIQSHVSAVGPLWVQLDYLRWRNDGIIWNSGRTSLRLLEIQVPSGTRWPGITQHSQDTRNILSTSKNRASIIWKCTCAKTSGRTERSKKDDIWRPQLGKGSCPGAII